MQLNWNFLDFILDDRKNMFFINRMHLTGFSDVMKTPKTDQAKFSLPGELDVVRNAEKVKICIHCIIQAAL